MKEENSQNPNVIVFFTDQQRWDTTGVHGNPLNLTPNFDKVAQEGTHVYNSFTCQPVCGPARSSIQTGLYPTETGCYKNGIPLPSNINTLGNYFNDAGYKTGYIGKWHLASTDPVPKDERGGYKYWLGANSLEHTSQPYDTIVYNNENKEVKLPGYRVDALTDVAIQFINNNKNEQFFLFLSLLEPHQQNDKDTFIAPDGYRNKYNSSSWIPSDLAALDGSAHQHLSDYYGMVKRIDEAFGRLLDTLKSLDIDENTIVLFTSDHGCHFKTRNDEYKRSCHESSIRVPMAIKGPGFNSGGQLQNLVSIIDIPPTLLEAAGLPVPDIMQGHSFMPLLKDKESEWSEEHFIQISESELGRAIRTRRWKYGAVNRSLNPLTNASANEYTESYLYDLYSDPHELTNLITFESHALISEILKERLIKLMVKYGESTPVIASVNKISSGQRKVNIDRELLDLN